MAGWDVLRDLLEEEFLQAAAEGKTPQVLASVRNSLGTADVSESELDAAFERLINSPVRGDFPYDEVNCLEAIRVRRPKGPRLLATETDGDELKDRLHGAWLGRCVGCALGRPLEAFTYPRDHLSSRDRQKVYLTAISPNEYPICGYVPGTSPAESETGKVGCPGSTREGIRFMEADDDIRYTVVGQITLAAHGLSFTSFDVARAWMRNLSYLDVCTAETQAYRNLTIRGQFHRVSSGNQPDVEWDWIRTHHNPYREWIGAQIRADSWGYAVPGMPQLAAELAWRDARISHVKNGIYGEMFVAAMIASAFVVDDVREIVEVGLSEIPECSRLHRDIRDTVQICERYGNNFSEFESILESLEKRFGHYRPVYTNNNAALVTAALLVSNGDFEKGVTMAVMGGWDTDCNGATAGSVLGAMVGARKLPGEWTDPLNDTLYTGLRGYDPISIRTCAIRSSDIARKIRSEIPHALPTSR